MIEAHLRGGRLPGAVGRRGPVGRGGRRAARCRRRRGSSSEPRRSSSPSSSTELATLHPGPVAVGLDVRGREVATRGWQRGSGVDLVELRARASPRRARAALIVTEIGRDGTLDGPRRRLAHARARAPGRCPVDRERRGRDASTTSARWPRSTPTGGALAGVIVGTALYEGRFTLAEALAVGAS